MAANSSSSSKRRLDDKHLKTLREVQASCPANKQCFDCHQRGPTYLNMTIGSFVCTSCSGILRGLNPPHRVKSISMASFTSDEIEFMRNRGNEYCRNEWMGTYDNNPPIESDSKDEQRIKDFMAMKYERKRWYVDPSSFRNNLMTPPITTTFVEISKNHSPSLTGNHVRLDTSHISQSAITRPVMQSASFPPPNTSSAGKMASMDFLSDLATDPFASSSSNTTNNVKTGFANFDKFNSAAVSPSGNSSVSAATPTPNQPPQKDKYAALADLDNLFHGNNTCTMSPPNQNSQQNSTVDWDGKGTGTSAWAVNGATYGNISHAKNVSPNFIAAPSSSNPFTITNFASTVWSHNNVISPASSQAAQGNPFVAEFPSPGGTNVMAPSPTDAFGSPFSASSVQVKGGYSQGVSHWGSPNQMPTSFTSPTNGNYNPSFKMEMTSQYGAWHPTGGNPFAAMSSTGPQKPASSNPFL